MSTEIKEHDLYQAEPDVIESARKVRERMEGYVAPYQNHFVRVKMMDGRELEGQIVNVADGLLYLNIQVASNDQRFFQSMILPLVLYELLVVTLLYT